jgi:hypothetical protein
MKTKIVKLLLVLIGSAALVTGCSTANQGGAGGDTMYGAGEGGNNGSVSPTNPFGLETGTGITR